MKHLTDTTNIRDMSYRPSLVCRLLEVSVEPGLRRQFRDMGLEWVPARFAKGKHIRVQRLLAISLGLLRCPGDGAFLALVLPSGKLHALGRGSRFVALRRPPITPRAFGPALRLGISRAAATRGGQKPQPTASSLVHAGSDRYARPLWLTRNAAHAWLHMQRSARNAGITLEAISGFRSPEYQASIIRRKLKRGIALDDILRVNAAPGLSEHETGRAIDIGCPGEPPAEESFENTQAFAWLLANAHRFGFRMSYPRENPFGIAFEPWHWCWHPPARGALAIHTTGHAQDLRP